MFTLSASVGMNAQFVMALAAVGQFSVLGVRGSFLHTQCGCRHVLLLATSGPYLAHILPVSPNFSIKYFQSGIYIHPVLRFYENIHNV